MIAPVERPQIDALALAGVQHPLGLEFMDALRQRGSTPVRLWQIINSLADARQPDSRDRRRCRRLSYLGACRELLKAGLLYRQGPLIAAARFAVMSKPRKRDRPTSHLRLSPSVGESTSKNGGSKPVGQQAQTATKDKQPVEHEPESKTVGTPTCTVDTQTAPASELLSIAARQLASLPRHGARRWSGWLSDGLRSFRNMRVQLPGGEMAFIFGVLRGRLVYTQEPDGPVGDTAGVGTSWGVIPASEARIIKSPYAVALGKRKAGIKEAFSLRKAQAARRNGSMPIRRRRRGRPPRPR